MEEETTSRGSWKRRSKSGIATTPATPCWDWPDRVTKGAAEPATIATTHSLLRIACKMTGLGGMLRVIRNNATPGRVMSFRFLPDQSASAVRMAAGQSVLIDPSRRPDATSLEVLEGMARVYCPCEETEGMTIAFLQEGDQLRTDRLCSEGVCVEALTPLSFRTTAPVASESSDAVNEWTLQLLRIRHLGSAEQRLHALLALLVNRMGRRTGDWCHLPFRLTHERIGELIGTTRVTTTRLITRIRKAGLLEAATSEPGLRLAPSLLDNAPLAA